jgi:two-component system NarL family sensor kinase
VLEIRRVVEGLRPPALDELGMVGALSQLLERLAASNTVTVELEASDLPPLPAAIEVAAYRIVAEAVTNVVRHADASACKVTIDAPKNLLRICVVDDGRGINYNGAAPGHGLQTMRERAEELRGRIHLSSVDGTTIVVELPCPQLPGPADTQPASEDQP